MLEYSGMNGHSRTVRSKVLQKEKEGTKDEEKRMEQACRRTSLCCTGMCRCFNCVCGRRSGDGRGSTGRGCAGAVYASSQTELADTQTEKEHLGTENNDAEDLPDDSMLIEDENPGETLPPDYGTDQETELAGNTEDESESETESETESESVTESETETEELLLEETESESEAESELGAMSGTCGLNGAKVQWALDDSGTLTVERKRSDG